MSQFEAADHQRSSGEAAAIQAQVAAARAQLLGGRGVGVSQTEIDEHTRARTTVDGSPTSLHLASVARQTAMAGRDTVAIALDLAAARQRLTATVTATTEKIRHPLGVSRFADRRVDAIRRHRASWLMFAVIAGLVLRKRLGRSRTNL